MGLIDRPVVDLLSPFDQTVRSGNKCLCRSDNATSVRADERTTVKSGAMIVGNLPDHTSRSNNAMFDATIGNVH